MLHVAFHSPGRIIKHRLAEDGQSIRHGEKRLENKRNDRGNGWATCLARAKNAVEPFQADSMVKLRH